MSKIWYKRKSKSDYCRENFLEDVNEFLDLKVMSTEDSLSESSKDGDEALIAQKRKGSKNSVKKVLSMGNLANEVQRILGGREEQMTRISNFQNFKKLKNDKEEQNFYTPQIHFQRKSLISGTNKEGRGDDILGEKLKLVQKNPSTSDLSFLLNTPRSDVDYDISDASSICSNMNQSIDSSLISSEKNEIHDIGSQGEGNSSFEQVLKEKNFDYEFFKKIEDFDFRFAKGVREVYDCTKDGEDLIESLVLYVKFNEIEIERCHFRMLMEKSALLSYEVSLVLIF